MKKSRFTNFGNSFGLWQGTWWQYAVTHP